MAFDCRLRLKSQSKAIPKSGSQVGFKFVQSVLKFLFEAHQHFVRREVELSINRQMDLQC
jgi:hypothetical protein